MFYDTGSLQSAWFPETLITNSTSSLQSANLGGVNLRLANLRGSNLKNCSLKGASLAGADLEVSVRVFHLEIIKTLTSRDYLLILPVQDSMKFKRFRMRLFKLRYFCVSLIM